MNSKYWGVERMQLDLSFIQHQIHRDILLNVLKKLCDNQEVIGILLVGSVARGDAYKESDIDLYVLLEDGAQREFQATIENGIIIEYKYADFEKAMYKIKNNAMEVYSYLDGKILYDKYGLLNKLTKIAQSYYNSYSISIKEKREISHWLESIVIKVKASINNEDISKALFIITTSSWEILKGIWAVNNIPIPPVGAIKAHLKDLNNIVYYDDAWFEKFFNGSIDERIDTAVKLSEWIIEHLR